MSIPGVYTEEKMNSSKKKPYEIQENAREYNQIGGKSQ
jgi:hypothetical protein